MAIAKHDTDVKVTDSGFLSGGAPQTTGSYTISTVPTNGKLVILGHGENSGAVAISEMRFGGQVCNVLAFAAEGTTGFREIAFVAELKGAALSGLGTGSKSFEIDWTGSEGTSQIDINLQLYSGVDQADLSSGDYAAVSEQSPGDSTIENTINALAATSWGVSVAGSGNSGNAFDWNQGQTELRDDSEGSITTAYGEVRGGSGQTTLSATRTTGSNNRLAMASIVLKEAAAGPSITDVSPSTFDMDEADVDVTGTGFEASQGSAIVSISTDPVLGDGTDVYITGAVTSWSDTAVNLDLTQLSQSVLDDLHDLIGPGARYINILTDSVEETGGFPITLRRPPALILSPSDHIASGGSPTTRQLSVPAGLSAGDFDAGVIWDDSQLSPSATIGADEFSEWETCWQFLSAARTGEQYEIEILIEGVDITQTVKALVTLGDGTIDAIQASNEVSEAIASGAGVAHTKGGAGEVGDSVDGAQGSSQTSADSQAVHEALEGAQGSVQVLAGTGGLGGSTDSAQGQVGIAQGADALGESLAGVEGVADVLASAGEVSDGLAGSAASVSTEGRGSSLGEGQDAAAGAVDASGSAGSVGEGQDAAVGVSRIELGGSAVGEGQDAAAGSAGSAASAASTNEGQAAVIGTALVAGASSEVSEAQDAAAGAAAAHAPAHELGEGLGYAEGSPKVEGGATGVGESLDGVQGTAPTVADTSGLAEAGEGAQGKVDVFGSASELGDSLSAAAAVGFGDAFRSAGALGEGLDGAESLIETFAASGESGESLASGVSAIKVLGYAAEGAEGIAAATASAQALGVTHGLGESAASSKGIATTLRATFALGEAAARAQGLASSLGVTHELVEGLGVAAGQVVDFGFGAAFEVSEGIAGAAGLASVFGSTSGLSEALGQAGFVKHVLGRAHEVAESLDQSPGEVNALANTHALSETLEHAQGLAVNAGISYCFEVAEGLSSGWGVFALYVPPRDVTLTLGKTNRVGVTLAKTICVQPMLRKTVLVSVEISSISGEELVVGDQVEVVATFKTKEGNVFDTPTARIRLLNIQSNNELKAEGGQLVHVPGSGIYSATFDLDYAGYWEAVADHPPGRGVSQLSFSVKPKLIPD